MLNLKPGTPTREAGRWQTEVNVSPMLAVRIDWGTDGLHAEIVSAQPQVSPVTQGATRAVATHTTASLDRVQLTASKLNGRVFDPAWEV